MSTISLKVEAFAGTTIEDACRDLCALADRVGILCEAGFNGVKLWAYPGTDPAQLAKAWGVQMERPAHIYRIASARPDGVAASAVPSDDEIRKAWNRTQDPIATVRVFLPSGVPEGQDYRCNVLFRDGSRLHGLTEAELAQHDGHIAQVWRVPVWPTPGVGEVPHG